MLTSRFWSKVEVGHPLACWKWKAAKNRDGYGSFGAGEGTRTVLAHRFAYQEFYGEIPPGQCVLHECDEPSCVNPNHLWLGTQADNVRDCEEKGRRNQVRLQRLATGKLSAEDRVTIRAMRANGYTQQEIADQFDVRPQTVAYWEKRPAELFDQLEQWQPR